MNFSLEISPKTDLDTLPALKDVYVTMLPGGDYKDTADQAIKLVENSSSLNEESNKWKVRSTHQRARIEMHIKPINIYRFFLWYNKRRKPAPAAFFLWPQFRKFGWFYSKIW